MAKKKTKEVSTAAKPSPSTIFPALITKDDLTCRVLLEDQILLIDVRQSALLTQRAI